MGVRVAVHQQTAVAAEVVRAGAAGHGAEIEPIADAIGPAGLKEGPRGVIAHVLVCGHRQVTAPGEAVGAAPGVADVFVAGHRQITAAAETLAATAAGEAAEFALIDAIIGPPALKEATHSGPAHILMLSPTNNRCR